MVIFLFFYFIISLRARWGELWSGLVSVNQLTSSSSVLVICTSLSLSASACCSLASRSVIATFKCTVHTHTRTF